MAECVYCMLRIFYAELSLSCVLTLNDQTFVTILAMEFAVKGAQGLICHVIRLLLR